MASKEGSRRAAKRSDEEWEGTPQQKHGGADFEEYDPDRPAGASLCEVQSLNAEGDDFGDDSDWVKGRDEIEARLGGFEAFTASAANATEVEASGLENIVGFGVGFKEESGHLTGELAVKVYVQHKLPNHRLEKSTTVPSSVAGMPTDVEQVGEIRPLSYTGRYPRPVRCGVSCGHLGVTAGTIGCLVILNNGRLAMLSNNHILANEGNAAVGDPIIQPGRLDRGNAPGDVIGVLEKFVPFNFSGINNVDAAAAWTARRFVEPTHVTYEMSATPVNAQQQMSVMKNGRTTRATMGTVDDIRFNVYVPFRGRRVYFKDQILITGSRGAAFSDGGDSGSIVVATATKQPVGLLFAGGRNHTVANPISAVIRELGIRSFVPG